MKDKSIYLLTDQIHYNEMDDEIFNRIKSNYAYIGNYFVQLDDNYNQLFIGGYKKECELYKDIIDLSFTWSEYPSLNTTLNAITTKEYDPNKNTYIFLPKINTNIGVKYKTSFKNSFNFLKNYEIDANVFNILLNNFHIDMFDEKIQYNDLHDLKLVLDKLNDKEYVNKRMKRYTYFFMKDVYKKFYESNKNSFIEHMVDLIFNPIDNKFLIYTTDEMLNIKTLKRIWYSNDYILLNVKNIEKLCLGK